MARENDFWVGAVATCQMCGVRLPVEHPSDICDMCDEGSVGRDSGEEDEQGFVEISGRRRWEGEPELPRITRFTGKKRERER